MNSIPLNKLKDMNFFLRFFCLFFLICIITNTTQAKANDFGLVSGNMAFSLGVESFKSRRFKTVVAQKYDYSCGSAALATLLKYHYQQAVTEQEVLDAMYNVGDKEKIKTQGFSLLDMKVYLAKQGLLADGFKVNLAKLRSVGVPGIVLINTKGYLHFVVIKGINDTDVLVGDPALGVRKISHDDFNKMWNNVFFVIRNKISEAKSSFTEGDEWSGRRQALFSTAMSNQALSTFVIQTQATPNIYN